MRRNLKQVRANLKKWAVLSARNDIDIVNIIYMLYKKKLTELYNEFDFCCLYNNLDLMSDYVDLNNIEEYKDSNIYNKLKRDLKNDDDFIMLHYFKIENRWGDFEECYIKLKKGHDVIFK